MAEEEEGKPKNIFPLHLLKVSENTQIMVEVKSGESYNGTLQAVDKFMNIKLTNAILTNANGDVFHSIKEVLIRGNTLKYFTLQNTALRKIEGTQYKAPEKWKDSQKNYRKKK